MAQTFTDAERVIGPQRKRNDLLRTYYQDLSRLPVLSPGQEFEMSQRIEDAEVALWAHMLSYAPIAESLLALLQQELALEIETVTLRRRARRLRQRRAGARAHEGFQRACNQLAAAIRVIDPDHTALDQVVSRLEALGRGETRRIYRRPLRLNPQGGPFQRYLDETRRLHSEVLRARQAFIEANLRLVMTMVKRYSRYCSGQIAMQDLVQEGNIGLIRAVGRYDPHRGFRFSTYASWWIRHAITRAIADKGRMVRLPVYKVTTYQKVARSRRQLQQLLGRTPTVDEISAHLNLDPEEVQESLQLPSDRRLLLSSVQADGESLLEHIADPGSLDANRKLVDHELFHEQVRPLLGRLEPMELDILQHRFGLDGAPTETLNQIGERYQLSRERIRQIQQEVLGRLRERLVEERAT